PHTNDVYTLSLHDALPILERELDYSRFAAHRLENDPLDFGANRIPFLWNGDLESAASGSGGWYRTATNSGAPNQVTIDMGVTAKDRKSTRLNSNHVKISYA